MSWSLRVTAGPTSLPVTLEDAKLHLRVDHDDEDGLITQYLAAATEWAEDFQGRAYVTRTYQLTMSRFPKTRPIYLPRPPLQSVTSISYYDRSDAEQTVDASDYYVDLGSVPARVVLKSGSWPSVANRPDAVTVTYVAGYGDLEDGDGDGGENPIPGAVRSAILLITGHLYENRESVTIGTGPTFNVPQGPQYLLSPQRTFERDPLGGC